MHYVPKTARVQLQGSLGKLTTHVNETDHNEATLSVIILQILRHYICCGHQCNRVKSPAPPPECDPLVEEAVAALSQFDTDAIEGVLGYYISRLLGHTLCIVYNQTLVSRSVGVLQRVAKLLGYREYWGDEGIRQGRALGVLRCAEFDLYRRAVSSLDNQYSLDRALDSLDEG